MNKPTPEEYAPFYGAYMKLVNDDPLDVLESAIDTTYNFFSSISGDMAVHAYAEGKWTIKEVLGHIIDAERTFAYRVLGFSRGQQELPGFDQNQYIEKATFNSRSIKDLAEELRTVRQSNMYLLRSLTPEQLSATGIANGNRISVNTIIYIMAGHELHHINIIKERYL